MGRRPPSHAAHTARGSAAALWRVDAACREQDTELFFPVGPTSEVDAATALARAVCERCPVSDACLHDALTLRIEHGIWGGTTPQEREKLVRERRPTVEGRAS
jgi:WhiB family redox-sensing transcriptional regulator